MYNDPFAKGAIGGLSGAIIQNIYAYIGRLLGFTNVDYLNVSQAVLLDCNSQGFFAILVNFLGHLIIDSFWGIVFAFLIIKITKAHLIIKGILFGLAIWFLVRVIITKVFHLPVLSDNTPEIAFFFFVGAALYGLTLSLVLKSLDNHKSLSSIISND